MAAGPPITAVVAVVARKMDTMKVTVISLAPKIFGIVRGT